MKNLDGTEVISRALSALIVAALLRHDLLHCNGRSGRRAQEAAVRTCALHARGPRGSSKP
ncbi:hypothetical protein ACNJYA_27300 [Bradyrhizobium sp. DASA03068]|uniref:hypothetical protein n=1 Tax=Bradyrhizobium sp. BLXBL-01 TaxID=3395915 RepID=UPI003F6E44E5